MRHLLSTRLQPDTIRTPLPEWAAPLRAMREGWGWPDAALLCGSRVGNDFHNITFLLRILSGTNEERNCEALHSPRDVNLYAIKKCKEMNSDLKSEPFILMINREISGFPPQFQPTTNWLLKQNTWKIETLHES